MITSLLRQVDTARVLAASAALQMDRDNLNELLVLQNLSRLAAMHPSPQGKDLSSSAIKRLLSADEVGGPDVLSQLDPFEGFPVVEVPVPPHRFLVLEGLATDSAEIAARALRAVFATPEIDFPARYQVEVSSAANFLLGLSDVLSRRFGRTVHDRAPKLTRKVTVPSGARLAELAQRVVFSREELFAGKSPSEAQFLAQSLMWRHGEMNLVNSSAPDGAQDEMPGAANEATPDDVFASMTNAADDDSSMIVRPLVETHLGIVVASPTSLAATLRHFIVVGAKRHDCVSQLVAALTDSAVSDLKFLLETTTDAPLRLVPARPAQDVDNSPGMAGRVPEVGEPDANTDEQTDVTADDHAEANPDVGSGAFPDPSRQHGVVRLTAPFDGDKILDVRLTVDTLDNYDPTTVWGHATTPTIDVTPPPQPADRVLILDTHLGIGRDHLYLGGDEHSPGLFASISDLSTIFHAPGIDRLTLWYFAKALHRLHKSTRVLSFSVVDTFAIYRDAHDSFYLSDDAAPHLMNVATGSGQELRDEAARAAGSPFALYGNGISRALACHGDASPVSVILADPGVCFARLGELTAWARCRLQPESTASGLDIHPHGTPELQLPESITYWLWQLHITEPSLLSTPPGVSELQVETQITRPHYDPDDLHDSGTGHENWVAHNPSATDLDPIVPGAGTVGFTLVARPPSSTPETGPPNHVDRQLIKALIDGLASINTRPDDWPADRRAAIVDAVAPAGYKEMTHIVRADDSLLLWPGTLPPARRVNDATTAQILDRLGEHLAAAGFRRGPIPDEDRTNFLNEHVTGYFIGLLEREVPELDAATALPRLVAMYEALLHESAADAERLPTRIACFGEHASDVKRIQRHRQSGTTSSISLRFLIEYVAAHAPTGSATLTNEKYDLLLAIASEVVNKGMLSDTLRRRLTDHQISVLASDRLGISGEQEAYAKAVTAFTEDLTTRTVRQAAELARSVLDTTNDMDATRTPSDVTSDDPTEPETPLQDLDVLATAEYGFSYTQLVAACGALIDASRESGQEDIGSLDEPTVRRVICESTGMGDANAQVMLDALTLAPVEDYWAGTDAYPWRFNRDRSYLRRPLVAMPSASSDARELLFGHRNVWLTPRHWLERHLTGRLRAKSPEMKRALAAQRDAKGAEFETEIEHTARGAGIHAVVRRFKKAGSLDLGNVDGKDLGDVDVLLVSPRGTVVAIEAKALETGRTPGELANEVDSLTNGPKAATTRIKDRVAVLTRHLREVEQALGLTHDPRRRIVPLVVTDAPLLGNYLSTSEVTIVALDELVDAIAAIDTARRRR